MIIFIFIFLVQVISADFTDTEECNRYLDENIEGIKNLVTHTLFRRKSRGCVPLVYLTESGEGERSTAYRDGSPLQWWKTLKESDLIIPPADLTFEEGAAFLLQGMTAHYLINDYRRPGPGDTVLIEESRPLSATKRWRLVSIVARAGEGAVPRAAVEDEATDEAIHGAAHPGRHAAQHQQHQHDHRPIADQRRKGGGQRAAPAMAQSLRNEVGL